MSQRIMRERILGNGSEAQRFQTGWIFCQRHLSDSPSEQSNPVVTQEIRYDNGGGVYPNMFDAAPPFQIDANFGVPAAMAEMLLQSQDGVIHLLPALPDAWKDGKVSGLCARGGFEVDLTWENGRLTTAVIRSKTGEPCRVSCAGKEVNLKIRKGESVELDGNLIYSFQRSEQTSHDGA